MDVDCCAPHKSPPARPSRMFVVGDPAQLCAVVNSPEAKRLRLDRPLMSRLIEQCGHDYTMLDTQYRMHPDISAFPRQRFYLGKLYDGKNVSLKDWIIPVTSRWYACMCTLIS